MRLGDGSQIVLRRLCATRLGLAAHLARLARSDPLGAIVRLSEATGGGLELIDGLAFDFRRSGDADQRELGGRQEPSLKLGRFGHLEVTRLDRPKFALCLRPRLAAKPKPAKPMIIIDQTGGSGTASEAISMEGNTNPEPLS